MLKERASASDAWIPWLILSGVVIYGLAGYANFRWPEVIQWRMNRQSADWPGTSAEIVIATAVSEVMGHTKSGPIIRNRGLLSYSYRHPELQSGDYSRTFQNDYDAQDWVAACKGRMVTVRVNPRDPAQSVLRTEDLDAVVKTS